MESSDLRYKVSDGLRYWPKIVLYLGLAFFTALQLTLVPAATGLILTSIVLMIASMSNE